MERQSKAHLCGSIDLRLPSILSLTQHRSSKKFIAILATNKISSFQKNSSSIIPGHALPCCFGGESTIDGTRNCRLVRFVVCAEVTSMIGRYRLFYSFSCLYLYAIYIVGVRIQNGGSRLTCLPFTIQGTSNGSSLSICTIAASNALRSDDPGG